MNHLAYQRRWNNDRASPWRKWGRWIALSEASPEARAGVYVLAVRRPDAQIEIARLLGVDHQGTLDIGESLNLRRRIASLAKCAFADGRVRECLRRTAAAELQGQLGALESAAR